MKKIKGLTFLFLGLMSINVCVADRLYKIELVIFAQNMSNTEVFDQRTSRIAWPKNVVSSSAYKQVSPQYRNLRGSYAKLAGGQGYRPLTHVAWIQSVKPNGYSSAVKISSPDGSINGFFRLKRGTLIQMIADIEYSPGSIYYRLKEKRRFKLNETHYLDHPKFGILARISPV